MMVMCVIQSCEQKEFLAIVEQLRENNTAMDDIIMTSHPPSRSPFPPSMVVWSACCYSTSTLDSACSPVMTSTLDWI